MKKSWLLVALIPVVLAVSPAEARRKHVPADNEICYNKALSAADKSQCLDGYSAASTVADRTKLKKTYKQKIGAATQAANQAAANQAAAAAQAAPPAPTK